MLTTILTCLRFEGNARIFRARASGGGRRPRCPVCVDLGIFLPWDVLINAGNPPIYRPSWTITERKAVFSLFAAARRGGKQLVRAVEHFPDFVGQQRERYGFLQEIHAVFPDTALKNNIVRMTGHVDGS